MDLKTHFFNTWYPAKELLDSSVAERRVHKWMVNMCPNPKARYIIIIRNETKDERKERLGDT